MTSLVYPTTTDLLTTFRDVDPALTENLGVMLVGLNYSVRPYDISSTYGLVGTYTGSTVVYNIPYILTGETVDTSSVTVAIDNAVINYYSDVAPTPSVAQGTAYAGTTNQITHNSQSTIWSGQGFTSA